MVRDGDISAAIAQENVVEHPLRVNTWFASASPCKASHSVSFSEPVLECLVGKVAWILPAAAIAGMAADSLMEKLLHFGNERMERRQVEAKEDQVRRSQTAC